MAGETVRMYRICDLAWEKEVPEYSTKTIISIICNGKEYINECETEISNPLPIAVIQMYRRLGITLKYLLCRRGNRSNIGQQCDNVQLKFIWMVMRAVGEGEEVVWIVAEDQAGAGGRPGGLGSCKREHVHCLADLTPPHPPM